MEGSCSHHLENSITTTYDYFVYSNNHNNNYYFVFLICLQTLCKHLFAIPLTQLFAVLLTTFLQATLVRYSFQTAIRYSAHNLFVSTNLYSLDLHSGDLLVNSIATTLLFLNSHTYLSPHAYCCCFLIPILKLLLV